MAEPGRVGWVDLTVDDAEGLRDFYAAVMGWGAEGFDGDYNMVPFGTSEPAAGVCHRRGPNVDLPPQWIVHFAVPDVETAAREAAERGGTVLKAGSRALVRDPAGALFALYPSG